VVSTKKSDQGSFLRTPSFNLQSTGPPFLTLRGAGQPSVVPSLFPRARFSTYGNICSWVEIKSEACTARPFLLPRPLLFCGWFLCCRSCNIYSLFPFKAMNGWWMPICWGPHPAIPFTSFYTFRSSPAASLDRSLNVMMSPVLNTL